MRVHNTEIPLHEGDLLRRAPIKQQITDHKPKGFWYATNDEWINFCKENNYLNWIGNFNYLVDISEANILILDNDRKILEFTKAYEDDENPGMFYHYINWAKVAKEFEGIEISPYSWNLRLSHRTHWYYGWDVASGCIWDLRNIKISLLK